MRIEEYIPVLCKYIPPIEKEGHIYISEEFKVVSHLCACGCKGRVITPINLTINNQPKGWTITKEITDNKLYVTLRPSIGNWSGESPYHAHYYITKNKVEWL